MKVVFAASLLATISLGFSVVGCNTTPWEGFVYPDENDLSSFVGLGHFKSRQECTSTASLQARRVTQQAEELAASRGADDYPQATWECGYKCRDFDSEPPAGVPPLRVCKETVDTP